MTRQWALPRADWDRWSAKRSSPSNHRQSAEHMVEVAAAASEKALHRLAAWMARESPGREFLATVLELSPYLEATARRSPEILDRLFDASLPERLKEIGAEIGRGAIEPDISEAQLMMRLRRLKAEAHFLIAIGDLAGEADTSLTVRRLSDLAQGCVAAAADFLLREADRTGKLRLSDREAPGVGSGWILLAMGKLGAHELNFSSDIDLIAFVDPGVPAILDPMEATDLFSRLTSRLARILQDRTEHGYVFRTDLRLRPDPGSTPLAIPVAAAVHYYEGRGQNWERAALIKARPLAGDLDAGETLLRELRPYIWRKHMDFAAIADVHSIKRQIHAHKGHGEIAVRGHNVKLGRGGIREIEFFVQTQQLIAGGRSPELRSRETVAGLARLAEFGWITSEARDQLVDRYWFLRKVENAIQMVNDEQAHALPEDDAGLARVGRLSGFVDADAFSDAVRECLVDVERHYAALFETAPQLTSGVGNLVFTGDVDDPDTLQTLRKLGFERPSDISRLIRTWHFGRYPATRSAEARERLTDLAPALLRTLGATRRADDAVIRFDEFLAGLPAGIQLFSLLHSNPGLLRLLALILGAAPRLAATISRYPHVFDGLLDPSLLTELPTKAYLSDRLASFLDGAAVYEERLDRLRIFAAEHKFLIGMRLLAGAIDAERAGRAFSSLADLTIASALDAVLDEFAIRHGRVAGGRVALLGLGKLGSRELSASSDVDLILLYDHDGDARNSDGEKPLAPSYYFARLTQRLIAAVSAPTAKGVLYELDLRLRPSGNKGPVATHIDAFRKYQREEAWTWEHMALTRARVVAGDAALAADAEAEVAAVLAMPRDRSRVVRDAADMRRAIETEKPPRDGWDLKLIPGGIIDLEFIAQCAVLTGCFSPEDRPTGTAEILSRLPSDIVGEGAKRELEAAYRLYAALTQILRLSLTGPMERDDLPPDLADLLLRVTECPDLGVLEGHLQETSQAVRKQFRRLINVKGS